MMRKATTAACGVLVAAGLAGAQAGERQVTELRYGYKVVGKVLVCPGTVAPSECDVQNALDVIVGPPSPTEIGCGVQSQAMLAGSSIRARQGQYVKVVCSRETAQSD